MNENQPMTKRERREQNKANRLEGEKSVFK